MVLDLKGFGGHSGQGQEGQAGQRGDHLAPFHEPRHGHAQPGEFRIEGANAAHGDQGDFHQCLLADVAERSGYGSDAPLIFNTPPARDRFGRLVITPVGRRQRLRVIRTDGAHAPNGARQIILLVEAIQPTEQEQ